MARGETIRLKGWAALIAIVLVGGFLAVKAFSAHSTLQSEAADLLKLQLAGEYASAHLSGESTDLATLGKNLLDLREIEFVSLRARGNPNETLIVRADIRVAGKTPPDGRSVRYFRMEYSGLTGWRHRGEATALSWWLALI